MIIPIIVFSAFVLSISYKMLPASGLVSYVDTVYFFPDSVFNFFSTWRESFLGTYNPLTDPKEIKLKQDRIDHWIKQGAQMSDGFLRIIGKAPQKPPRKPKKEKKGLF